MADFSRYAIKNLDERRNDSIDGIRECFFKEERFQAIEVCKKIKEKGYKLFVQPVDILGYSDFELIEFIQEVNTIEPFCFSIVDTFGSMYQEELLHCFEIIHHNLVSTCKIGFHSHNNLQMSNALSQEFMRMAMGKREVIVDGTVSGMGRGAGNTPTELIAQYMVSRMGGKYDIDAILDVIDNYMDNIRTRCSWGYNTDYFIAGSYGAHVNNIQYLIRKASIQSKDIRYILNKIGTIPRKRYDYDLLEKTYLEYMDSIIDDEKEIEHLKKIFANKNVLLLIPGKTAKSGETEIISYIENTHAIVVSVNFLHDKIESSFLYISNVKRYQSIQGNALFSKHKRILTSNIKKQSEDENEIIVSFSNLIKCGWEHMDNSTILLLRLLDRIDTIKSIAIAGFDGYDSESKEVSNYVYPNMEKKLIRDFPSVINEEIISMLKDYKNNRNNKHVAISFVTPSRFSHVFEEAQ